LASRDLKGRFPSNFAYVDAVLPDGSLQPLFRLHCGSSATFWGFAIHLASKDGYEDSVLPTGRFDGTPPRGPGLRLPDMG
jgi:hypothetical protein